MYDKYNSNQIFTNAKFGIQRAFQALDCTDLNGLSKDDFKYRNNIALNDITFAELIKQDFKSIDKDNNQTVSSKEIQSFLSGMEKQGLSYAQLAALQSQGVYIGGNSDKMIEELMKDFKKIDQNRDGKVSVEEINAYRFEKEIEKTKETVNDFKASDLTIFYTDDSSSNENLTEKSRITNFY